MEEIIKGAKGQAARVQIQNEATEIHATVCHATSVHSFTLFEHRFETGSKHFPTSKATIKQLMLVQQKQAEVGTDSSLVLVGRIDSSHFYTCLT